MPKPLLPTCVCGKKVDPTVGDLVCGQYRHKACIQSNCSNCGAPVGYTGGFGFPVEIMFVNTQQAGINPGTGRCGSCGAPTVPSPDPDEAAYGEVTFSGFTS